LKLEITSGRDFLSTWSAWNAALAGFQDMHDKSGTTSLRVYLAPNIWRADVPVILPPGASEAISPRGRIATLP
jgi:hypothetical protein